MAGRDVVDVDLCEADALAKSIHTYRRNPELSAAGGGLSVILSEAKDLMPVVSGDEILRFAQDDRKVDEHRRSSLMKLGRHTPQDCSGT
ncbi:MAG TPA: hypothetical protein VII10_20460, partial [Reyranella sp.]